MRCPQCGNDDIGNAGDDVTAICMRADCGLHWQPEPGMSPPFIIAGHANALPYDIEKSDE